ncbi:MAG TPA: TetR/AcrR family transcriptional regulator [Stackebrandtia sp.]|uniref:TetR/AcrR family transcriptional regulator n=1 Tax=Stackebrandtia sp. TaxID=2023065 RepID=UPI002D40E234|nr:TetR/AcrR family transcriptional regulator [Stackebrandtia sp.]HZE37793.1 TetR/AcrR family transcriptional regulator [Stackebrandtia sp.]
MPAQPARADARRNRARILDAAAEVFNARGTEASTQDVARAAGVGIGTVFRHFPTKGDLLRAIVVRDVEELTAQIEALVTDGDPATAFFAFFTDMVARASSMRTIVRLLGESGADLQADKPLRLWRSTIEQLLAKARDAGAVRRDVGAEEVLALLLSTCQAAVSAGWDADLQQRTLGIIFDGLRIRPSP